MTVDVHARVGEYAITTDDGQRIFSEIHPVLKAGDSVVLDFAEVRVFASPFFNASIGHLLEDIRPDELSKLLNCTHLSAVGHSVMTKVLQNAEEYYYRPELREALDAILRDAKTEDVDQ
jgi:hypothetical protein